MSDEKPQPRVQYELWQRIIGDEPYTWMVWEVGPLTGGENWFESEREARSFIAAAVSLADTTEGTG